MTDPRTHAHAPTPGQPDSFAQSVIDAIHRVVGQHDGLVLLHGPTIDGNAWDYVKDCLDTAWVSSAGAYVQRFENALAEYTGAAHAIAVVNGTAALHLALKLAGVREGDEVIMPALTFVATANAASYTGAMPHFVDVDPKTLGLDPAALAEHLQRIAEKRRGQWHNRHTGRRLAAIVPMHTFGHPVELTPLLQLARQYDIPIVEDAAESLGSWYENTHTGRFGQLGVLSFNGNKIITTGAGGAILTDDPQLAQHARHLSTTAKQPHPWEYVHDELGYNYRMPNLNAALGCAQMEQLPHMLQAKHQLMQDYQTAFQSVHGVQCFQPPHGQSNHWLNAILLDHDHAQHRDSLLAALAETNIQARPVWRPMHELPMYQNAPRAELTNTQNLAQRLINLPSSALLRRRQNR